MSKMKTENGHKFDFSVEVCKNCGISWNKYQDKQKPICISAKKIFLRNQEHT